MTVLLARAYAGNVAGNTIQVATNVENAIIAQGIGTVVSTAAAAAVTTGAQTTSLTSGRATIAAAASSVAITNPLVDVNSKIFAVVNQAAADTTLLRVERIVPAAGSFTIYGTAAATAAISIDWVLLEISGVTAPVNT